MQFTSRAAGVFNESFHDLTFDLACPWRYSLIFVVVSIELPAADLYYIRPRP